MNVIEKHIDYGKISPNEFEEMCFELILRHGFSKVCWRQGGADNGRDIEATFTVNNSLIGSFDEKFFFECKRYEKGVPPDKLYSKIAWADAENLQYLVFILSSYLTNNCRTWLDMMTKKKHYKIHVIDGKMLSKLISQHEDIITKYFIKNKHYNVLLNTIEKWLLSFISPNFETLYYLWENLDFKILTTNQKVFLYVIYYANFEQMEVENEAGYRMGVMDVSDILCELSNDIKATPNCNNLVLGNEKITESPVTNYGGNCDFIASQTGTKTGDLLYYVFRRISKSEAIEICLYHNSTLDYRIRYIDNYKFTHYVEAVKYLFTDRYAKYNIRKKVVERIIDEHSENMK